VNTQRRRRQRSSGFLSRTKGLLLLSLAVHAHNYCQRWLYNVGQPSGEALLDDGVAVGDRVPDQVRGSVDLARRRDDPGAGQGGFTDLVRRDLAQHDGIVAAEMVEEVPCPTGGIDSVGFRRIAAPTTRRAAPAQPSPAGRTQPVAHRKTRTPLITLSQARVIIDRSLQFARERSLPPMPIAVLDAGGYLVAFARKDDSSLLRERIARAKAHGALNMGMGSRALAARAEGHPHFINAQADGTLVPVPGGVLVRNPSGLVIGAAGVCGHLPDDEACAVQGIETASLRAAPGT
jgi:uncharacterized protein GlcG (DUF336 family)